MKEIRNSQKMEYILDILATGIISVLLLFFLGDTGLASFIILVPNIVLAVKYGYKELLIVLALSIVASFIFLSYISIIVNFSFIVILSIVISIMLNKKMKAKKIVLTNSIILISIIFLAFLIAYFITKTNQIELIREQTNIFINELQNTLKNDINFSSQQLTEYIVYLRTGVEFFISIIPAVVIIYSILVVGLNTLISIKFLKKIDIDLDYNLNLNKINLGAEIRPLLTAIAFIIIGLYIFDFQYSELIIDNLSTIILFLLFVNGLLVLDYILQKRMRTIFRIIFFVTFIVIFQAYIMVAVVGFIDSIINLRKFIERRENNEK